MGPESRVVPSLSCVIKRFSNQSCQKVSRCPFTRMTYLIRLCSVRMAMLLYRTRIRCQREKYRSQKSTLRSHFASREGKESGGQKDTLIVASGSAALEVEQRTRRDERRVRAKITPVPVPPRGFYSPLPTSAGGCRHVS